MNIAEQPEKKSNPAAENKDGTVGKALTMLDIVEGFGVPVKFNDILKISPFPKPSAYRLLQTLVNQELLSFNADTGHYSLGGRLIRLAHSAWQNATIAPIAAPFLDALSRETGETIHLAKLDNAQVLYLDKRNAAKPINMFSDAGKIGPAYCTGVGKAMMAFLDKAQQERHIAQQSFFAHTPHTLKDADGLRSKLKEIQSQGYAFDEEEHETSIICIGVPIIAKNHAAQSRQVLGGLSITSSTSRTSLEALRENYKDKLINTAEQISEAASSWMLPKSGG